MKINKLSLAGFYALFFVMLCLHALPTSAQKKPTAEEVVNNFEKDSAAMEAEFNSSTAKTGRQQIAHPQSNSAYDSIKFLKELKGYEFNLYHTQRTYTWQYYSGIVIFIMVVVIVSLGLILSFKQFSLTELQIKNNFTKPKDEVTVVQQESSTIEISQTGLKINTAVIGLAILFLSLVFFFLYLKYVYVIQVLDTSN